MSRKKARIPTAKTILTNRSAEDELKKELFREIYYRYRSAYRLAVRERQEKENKTHYYSDVTGVPVGIIHFSVPYGS
jgi:hypothetical protein